MIPIKKNLVSSSKYSIKCPFSMTPTRVVIHNTGSDASAASEIKYMIGNSDEVSYHFAVDDKEAVQGVLENRNTWNANDGNGKGNRQGISIEICYSLSGGDRFIKAEKNAAILTAYLLKKYGWGIAQVTKHQDYSEKYCPHRTLNMGWQRFLNMVAVELKNLKEELTVTQYEELTARLNKLEKENEARGKLKCPAWARKLIQKAIDRGILKGDGSTKATPDTVAAQAYATRADVITICERYFNLK